MAVTTTLYTNFKKKLLNNSDQIDFTSDTIKVALLTSSYTPDQDAHDFFNDVSGAELAASGGYTAGGITLTTPVVDQKTAGHFGYFDADDITWSAASFTCRYAVVYKSTGNAATSPLIGYVDFGADQTPAGVNFTITWNADTAGGVVKIA